VDLIACKDCNEIECCCEHVPPPVETIYLTAGNRARPVKVARPRPRTLALSFGFSRPLVDEVKNLKSATWHPVDCDRCHPVCKNPKSWTISDCERNRIQLALLQGQMPKELERYERPLEPFKFKRDGGPCPCGGKRPDCHGCKGTGVFHFMKHQGRLAARAWTVRRCIWAAEPGTGKSASVYEVMERARDELGFTDFWWISPKSTQEKEKLELQKWGCTIEPKFVHWGILARELQARFQCTACGEVLIEERTRNGADGEIECRECRERGRGLFKRLPDRPAPQFVVMDESGAHATNPGAKCTKAAMLLAEAVRLEHDGFVVEMTGIPAPHDPCNWYAQAEIVQPGYLREGNRGKLLQRLAVIEKVQLETHAFPKIVSWRRDEVELLKKRLEGLVEIVLAKDCLDLPELRREIVRLTPSPEVLRAARLIAHSVSGAAQVLDRLRQFSDGFQYRDEGPAARAASPKDDALRNLLEQYEETGRIIVYGSYHESVDKCAEICHKAGWSVAQRDGRGWQFYGLPEGYGEQEVLIQLDRSLDTGEVDKLAYVAHPKSGGIGTNLTACPAAVYYSLDWDYGTFGQSLARGHRTGMDVQRGFVAWILCHLPTDEYVLKNLDGKREKQAWTLEEVQAVLG
jgi:hypothetical protein